MSQDLNEQLRAGIAAAKSGQREQARELLTQVVQQDEKNIAGWLWLSGVVDSLEDREVCLENVLALEPNNAAASKGLSLLRKQKAGQALSQGIASAKSGQRQQAREWLAQAVELDEKNPTAWLWLSCVVDDLEERQICLQNALDLDPNNEAARKGLAQVQQQLGPRIPSYSEAAAVVQTAPEPEPAPPPYSILDELDDESLCPYCAAPTQQQDQRCRVCDNPLWVKTRRENENRSVFLWILIVVQALGALSMACGFFSTAMAALSGSSRMAHPAVAWIATVIYGGILSVYVLFLIGLYQRWAWVYYIYLAASGLNVLSGVFLVILSLLAPALLTDLLGEQISPQIVQGLVRFYLLITVVATLISLGWFALVWAAMGDFRFEKQRLTMRVDPGARGATAFLARGRDLMRQKMWALAALHLQRAVMAMPGQISGRLPLALALVRLKRYDLAAYVLEEARRIGPDDPDIRDMQAMLNEARSKSGQRGPATA